MSATNPPKISEKLESSKKHEWIQAEVLTSGLDTSGSGPPSIPATALAVAKSETAETTMQSNVKETPSESSQSTDKKEEVIIWKFAAGEGEIAQKKSSCDITTLFVMGNKGAGKTSLINCFLETPDTGGGPRPTLALDFSFARRTTSDFVKQVCHIWELGGDVINFSDLLEPPIIHCRALEKLSLAIVLDLSEPNNIWATLEASFYHAKKYFSQALGAMNKGDALVLTQELEKKMAARVRDAVEDKDNLDPFPIPVIIIGTKYDIFQSFEPEKRKTICRLLRIASHRFGASLNFYSKSELSLNRRIREMFCWCAFDTPFPKEICLDMMTKPLLIPFGGDSYQQIWSGVAPTQFTMDYCRHLYETKVGKTNAKFSITDNPSLDPNFKEFDIDQQRATELEKLAMRERNEKIRPDVTLYTGSGDNNENRLV